MKSILVVEDEDRISSFIAKGLGAAGFTTEIAADGITGRDLAITGDFDLLVLDIGLPSLDGFSVLEQLREQRPSLPVLVLTARDNAEDTIYALESGAVDYMIKPFRFGELLARIRLRLKETVQESPTTELTRGDVRIDLLGRQVWVNERIVDLSARELSLAEILLRNRGSVLSREQLLSHVWGFDFDPGSNVVDVYVGYLRRKLGSDFVTTVRGFGYRVD
ncbi:response regulator transcription factor [Brevibacterium casei]|uniref:DNA-binding response regulator n=1 Tax=Brevibacterium casei TaxID=33889 RepID=A0A269ZBP2_9MICO|nr:response regulator transcription factor [Brevibacterium casei]MCT1764533.1 response regulator transcription factor [Brevibacterium casei]MDH5149003.1 response regulator transcription factor [Brevibacterium casei]PAK95079.1 DNA-binding response regulator [Brevibacterium casei]QPS34039.1 response regulator transcription factor [Brevibacterium casei]VEW13634.1 Transcriptional regulatory protein CusR [Brevibacterium casei]